MTPQQSPSQVRVQDPILTTHAHGYRHMERVAPLLFPLVRVFVSGGQVLEFDKSSFRKYNSRRAPGAGTKRINFGYLGKPFALIQDALESPLPREFMRDAAVTPGIDLGKQRTNGLMSHATLQHEIESADIATSTSSYASNNRLALSGSTQFSHADSDPVSIIEEGREAVRSQVGAYPNVCIAGPKPHKAFKNNARVIDRFKYTTPESITPAMLAQLIEVERYAVGTSVWVNDADENVDVWGNNIILAYVPPEIINLEARYAPNDMLTFETPSYGYTYVMDGHPVMEEPYYEKNAKSWIYGYTFERAAVLTGMGAGYLLSNVAA